ncbi:putative membrane protein [Mycobacterium xenopi 4042]|uniref:Putative membrane protein n=1 Tax=Mycobacterium xenopi 4042 TaxID=1299334 RepID=X7ZYT6_MYCXE|nr:putative membrane protein [Mycobacterium xenopi 4042]EUA52003.1 putative membrane protein [Mycobacterium xenopi 3993]
MGTSASTRHRARRGGVASVMLLAVLTLAARIFTLALPRLSTIR